MYVMCPGAQGIQKVTGGCELSNVSAGNQTRILRKSSKCSKQLSPLSPAPQTIYYKIKWRILLNRSWTLKKQNKTSKTLWVSMVARALNPSTQVAETGIRSGQTLILQGTCRGQGSTCRSQLCPSFYLVSPRYQTQTACQVWRQVP